MAKKVGSAMVKLQIPAGKANPAPPVGPALGQHQVNIMEFCKQFNAADAEPAGDDHSRRHNDLQGSQFHIRPEDAPRRGSVEEGGGDRVRVGRAEQDEGRAL